MKTLLTLAAGVWLGRRIAMVLTENRTRERELILRKRLKTFMSELSPDIPTADIEQRIKTLFK